MTRPYASPNKILMPSGRYVDPLHLEPKDILLTDIAHNLSHQGRFSGATSRFYSVAEHSLRVAEYLDGNDYDPDPETVRLGLLHDASEAYLQDIPSPLKELPEFRFYRKAEQRAMAAITEALQLITDRKAVEDVENADLFLLATERRDLMPPTPERWESIEEHDPIIPYIPANELPITLDGSPYTIRRRFLDLHADLVRR